MGMAKRTMSQRDWWWWDNAKIPVTKNFSDKGKIYINIILSSVNIA